MKIKKKSLLKFVMILLALFFCYKIVNLAILHSTYYHIGGLYIKLNEEIWDMSDSYVFPIHSTPSIEDLGQSILRLDSELVLGKDMPPSVQFGYIRLTEWDYKEYWEQLKTALYDKNPEKYLLYEETVIDGFHTRKTLYSDDGNYLYSFSIGKGHYVYGITYSASEKYFDTYLDEFEKSIDSIEIKYMNNMFISRVLGYLFN